MAKLAAHKSEGKALVCDIDPVWELRLGEILAVSNEKYPNDENGDPNWWKGGEYRSFAASARRHISKWLAGEDFDPESGKPHLWHAGWNIMVLNSWQERDVGTDNRLRRPL